MPRSTPRRPTGRSCLPQLGLEEKRNAAFCEAVRRAEAAPVHRPGTPARPAVGLPGRADHRPRPAGPPCHLGPGARGARQGQDGPADHPFYGRGRAPVRPGRHPRPRPDRGAGHPGSPDPQPGGGRTRRLQPGRDSAGRLRKSPFRRGPARGPGRAGDRPREERPQGPAGERGGQPADQHRGSRSATCAPSNRPWKMSS